MRFSTPLGFDADGGAASGGLRRVARHPCLRRELVTLLAETMDGRRPFSVHGWHATAPDAPVQLPCSTCGLRDEQFKERGSLSGRTGASGAEPKCIMLKKT